MRPLKLQNKPRILLVEGVWRAASGHGVPKKQRNLLLFCAISACNRMNNEQKRNRRQGAKQHG